MRTLLLGLLVTLTPLAVSGQDIQPAEPALFKADSISGLNILRHISYNSFEPAAISANTAYQDVPTFLLSDEDDIDIGGINESLSQEQILRRMGRIYEYQAELMQAQAREDIPAVEDMLDISMSALSVLLNQPGMLDNEQFQDLYRTVVTQHDRYYGFNDSLAVERGDIFQVRDVMFSALNEEGTSFERIELPEFSFSETEVELTINDKVRNSIVFLLTDPDRHINNWLSRADTYFPMIEQILREEGVPDELKYLAMIESGLNPDARSWAAAVGMWQFIRATGTAYGLNTNGWVDERRNPEKATRAAAKHLKDLHRMFGGDWQLALAGYNYSPGKLRRHLRRAEARLGRKATFWDVYTKIPRETRNYVPMFIATTLVASNPQEFGLDQGYTPGKPYEFDYVPVYGMLSLGEIASMAQTDVATVKALNPELRGNSLPPTRAAYYVRLPLYSFDTFAENYSKLPAASKRPASHHKVRRGETLGQIARRYGVSVSSLMRKNGLHSSLIRVGQNLVVPITNYSGGIDISDASPMRVQYGMRSFRPIAPNKSERLDSQLLIARAQERAEEKRAKEAEKEQKQAAKKPAPAPSTTTASSTTQKPKNQQTQIIHRVRRGDTLIDIARKYRVTVPQIREWNNIKSNLIQIGQRLTIYQKTS